MNIEEKLSAIKAINEQKEQVEKELAELESVKPEVIYSVSLMSVTEITISDTEVSRTMWHLLRNMLLSRKSQLIDKATQLMK